MTKKTDDKNLPAVTEGQTFELTTLTDRALQLDPALLEEIDQTDTEGYEAPRQGLPIVSIRQKELKDPKTGDTMFQAGGFRIYDQISEAADQRPSDISGKAGLLVTILADQKSRVYFKDMNSDKPDCRSNDGKTGNPGIQGITDCSVCPLSQWHGSDRPACSSQMNLLVYDHALSGCYVLRLGRSGLRPYDQFKTIVRRGGNGTAIPYHALMVRVTTKYQPEPAPHYTPNFIVEKQVEIDDFRRMKSLRREMNDNLKRATEVDTVDEEHHGGMNTADPGGEVPPGVDTVETAETAQHDDGLPF